MITDLSTEARELIRTSPELINKFAERINRLIDNWDAMDPDHKETLEPIEINHVEYTPEQCGYEK